MFQIAKGQTLQYNYHSTDSLYSAEKTWHCRNRLDWKLSHLFKTRPHVFQKHSSQQILLAHRFSLGSDRFEAVAPEVVQSLLSSKRLDVLLQDALDDAQKHARVNTELLEAFGYPSAERCRNHFVNICGRNWSHFWTSKYKRIGYGLLSVHLGKI